MILCGAEESGNVGGACRAMMNMGIERLVLAACPEYDEAVLRARAVHAAGVYDSARRFPSLEEALAEFSLSAGFTRRRGEKRKNGTIPSADFAAMVAAKPGPVALVFGNERTGLTDRELALCSLAVHIPSADPFPSLNLSHAVQIACYDIFRTEPSTLAPSGNHAPARRSEAARAAASVTGALRGIGFFKIGGRDDFEEFFRDLVERASLCQAELVRLERVFRKAAAMAKPKEVPGLDGRGPSS